jgi:hypothetical protein
MSDEAGLAQQQHKLDPTKVAAGNIVLMLYWAKVLSNDGGFNRTLRVRALDGDRNEFNVIGDSLIAASFSADQFVVEEKVTKTKAAELLVAAFNRPLTVCFTKADGSERVLRGRLVEPEPLLGRSHVEDLDVTDKHRLRLVDHRTLRWLIVNGIKYTVKGA